MKKLPVYAQFFPPPPLIIKNHFWKISNPVISLPNVGVFCAHHFISDMKLFFPLLIQNNFSLSLIRKNKYLSWWKKQTINAEVTYF